MSHQVSRRQQERNEQILRGLLKEPGNSKCADCFAPNPSWASYNLGIFLCIRCAMIHRKIGTHVTKTKSLTLDKWTPEQIATMRSIGNTKSNEKYNPYNKPPPSTAFASGDASDDIQLERYIRNKYERESLMKPRSQPTLQSPMFQGDPDKVNAILGPPARSPSLASSSSANARPGQRVSGESFERAKSPASTNSSLEIPPPKPHRSISSNHPSSANPFAQDDPWSFKTNTNGPALTNPSPSVAPATIKEVLYSQDPTVVQSASTAFNQRPNAFSLGQQPQPLPQLLPSENPFKLTGLRPSAGQRSFSLPVVGSVSQPEPSPIWNTGPLAQSPTSTQPMGPPLTSPTSSVQRAAFGPRSPGVTGPTSHNPFLSQASPQSAPSLSPTNPFFNMALPRSSLMPAFQPQQPQVQPIFQPQTPQPFQSQQTQFQQPFQSQQTQFQQPTQQPFIPNQAPSNATYSPTTMDKQSILNLFNSPSPSSPQFVQGPNSVPAWSQQGMQF